MLTKMYSLLNKINYCAPSTAFSSH